MKADLLRHEFASDAVPDADGRLLLEPGDTIALIDRATEEGVPIVAVRGVPDARHAAARADAARLRGRRRRGARLLGRRRRVRARAPRAGARLRGHARRRSDRDRLTAATREA
jgi:hypothetical protein